MNQTITLNLIPNGIPEVAYVSQCDIGREITCKLYEGTASYSIPSGATLTVNGAKEDKTIFEYDQSDGAITWTSGGNEVTIITLQQMTIVEGDVLCQIRITKDGDDIGVLNFIMRVMPMPMLIYGGGAPSTTELPELIALATEQEQHAAASATAAADSATSASNSATSAAESATSAGNSATSAENSAISAAESAQSAIAWSAHPPYIGANGNWYVWNTTDEQYEDSGIDASITVTIADITMLAPDATPTVTNSGSNTDPIFHLGIPRGKGISGIAKTGTSGLVDTYTITYSDGYTSTFTVTNGKSAYQYATEGGYSGTESDFYSELAGVHEYAEDSEAYAIGKRGGTDVGSSDPAYHNNAKYYAGEAEDSATAAGTSETNAESSAQDAEAYAVGKRYGVDVPSTDPAYHNNAKYYSEQASAVTVGKNDKITVTTDSNALTDASTVLSATTGENPTAMASHALSKFWTYISGKITGAISGLLTTNLTPSKALTSDANGKVSTSDTTSTELSYLHGVTGAVQTQLDGGVELLKDTVGWSGKNLFESKKIGESATIDGVTFNVNSDGSVTINGTSSGEYGSDFALLVPSQYGSLKNIIKEPGRYIVSFAPSASIAAFFGNELSGTWDPDATEWLNQDKPSYEFSVTNESLNNSIGAAFYIRALYNVTYSNAKVYPMIRRADIIDGTYEPYHAPVVDTIQQGVLKDVIGWSGKNLIGYPSVWHNGSATITEGGVTLTKNSDGSVTINGTGDEDYAHLLNNEWHTKYNGMDIRGQRLALNGILDTTVSTDIKFLMYDSNNNAICDILINSHAEKTGVVPLEFDNYAYYIYTYNGVTYNNVTVYPMIRRADVLDPTYEPYHAPVQSISDNIAPTEGATASGAYTAGSYIIWRDGNLYQVTTAVSQETAWAVGTNLSKVTVGSELKTQKPIHMEYPSAGSHNAVYRGKYLGTSVTAAQWASIAAGTFDDLYIGDYWTIGGVNWRIAAFDYWINTGDTACTDHHVVIVPDTDLYNAAMNDTDITVGGYYNSKMRGGANYPTGGNLSQAKTMIDNAFGASHVLSHREILTNAANGYPTNGQFYDSTVDLMNEQMVYGSRIHESCCNGTNYPYLYTNSSTQLPLFSHRANLLHDRNNWWMRSIASSNNFSINSWDGVAIALGASNEYGVHPCFGIK